MTTAREGAKVTARQTRYFTINEHDITEKINALSQQEFQSLFYTAVIGYAKRVPPLELMRFKSNHAKAFSICEDGSADWKKDLLVFLETDTDSYAKAFNSSRSLKLEVLLELFKLNGVQFNADVEKSLIITIRGILFKQIESAKIEEHPVATYASPVAPKRIPSACLFKPAALEQKAQAKLLDEIEISTKLNAVTEKKFPTIFFSSFNSFPLHRWAELSFPWRPARSNRLKEMQYMTWKIDLYDFLREETPQNKESFKFHVLAAFLGINKEDYKDQEAHSLVEKTKLLLHEMIQAEYKQAKKSIAPSLGSRSQS